MRWRGTRQTMEKGTGEPGAPNGGGPVLQSSRQPTSNRARRDRPEALAAARAQEARAAALRALLTERLRVSGVSKRALSLIMHKDEAYLQQFLDAGQERQRTMPTPDELRLAAPHLGIGLVDLLRVAFGITAEELSAELGTLAAHSGALGAEIDGLTPDQLEEVRAFVAFVKARVRYRALVREETPASREPPS
jgi:hypothetical protein